MERLRNVPASAIGTSLSTLYTAPGEVGGLSGLVATSLQVANSGSVAVGFTAQVNDVSSGVTIGLCYEVDIKPKSALNVLAGKTVLEAGDSISIKAVTAGVLDVLLSGVEKTL